MKEPTARQREIWEAVERHGGTGTSGAMAKAARDLGCHQANVHSALVGYARRTGITLLPTPPPPEHPHISRRERRLLAEAVGADQHIEQLNQRITELSNVAARLDRIEKLLAQLVERPIGVVSVSNRRIADGGRRVKARSRRVA